MKQYLELLRDIRENGLFKNDRTGTGTYSTFGQQLRFDISGYKFPLLTTKKMHLKSIIHELLWFLQGTGEVDYLVQNGVTIWNEWIKPGTHIYKDMEVYERVKLLKAAQAVAFETYREGLYSKDEQPGYELGGYSGLWRPIDINDRLHTWLDLAGVDRRALVGGDLGPVYGVQWRNWPVTQEVKSITLGKALRYLTASESEAGLREHLEAHIKPHYPEFDYDLWIVAHLNQRLDEIKQQGQLDNATDSVLAGQCLSEWLEARGYSLTEVVTVEGIDQIAQVIERLKTNPDCRRMIVTAWNPAVVSEQALPACHNYFQFWTRPLTHEERVSALWRSNLIRKADLELHGATEADVSDEAYVNMDPEVFREWADANGIPKLGLSCNFNMR